MVLCSANQIGLLSPFWVNRPGPSVKRLRHTISIRLWNFEDRNLKKCWKNFVLPRRWHSKSLIYPRTRQVLFTSAQSRAANDDRYI